MSDDLETWDIWYPDAGSQGLSFCRARIEPAGTVLVHAAPESMRVEVRDAGGRIVAAADQLRRDGEYRPMTRLRRAGDRVVRDDVWPTPDDIGSVVLLAGGEAGVLTSWWNAPDGSEWRWSLELYNRR